MLNLPNSFKNNPFKHAWHYKNQNGKVIGGVVRYDGNDGTKDVVPFFKINGDKFEMGGAIEPRPLFGLEFIFNQPKDNTLFIAEGERCAAALHSLGLKAITSCGGSSQANKADWTPLDGQGHCIILPDNDSAGIKYARDVVRNLTKLKSPPQIKIVNLPQLPPAGDVVDWIQQQIPDWDGFAQIPQGDRESLRINFLKLCENSSFDIPAEWSQAEEAEWGLPISHDDPALRPWPELVFPQPINGFISELSAATETPIELPAMMVMAILGMVCAGKYKVQIKPDYFEPLNIWTCVALPPASLKTAILKAVIQPLQQWEFEQKVIIEPKVNEAESQIKTLTERVNKKRRDAANAKGAEKCQEMQLEVRELEMQMPIVPKVPQLWTEDVTVEKLAVLMAENDERIGILSDEGGIFENMAGRYSGGIPNLDVFLKGHASSPVRVNRTGRGAVFLNNPCLSIGLAPQPEVLRGLNDKPGFRGRGLLARFLYALPHSNLGKRTRNAAPMPPEISRLYNEAILNILNQAWLMDESGKKISHIIRLDESAHKVWKEFGLRVEIELADGGKFEHIRDWAGKLAGAVARIAGILHVVRYAKGSPESRQIDLPVMEAATEIGECLSSHALAVFGMMGADPANEGAASILKWIRREGLSSFKQRDCHYVLKNTFKKSSEVEASIQVLVERNYLRKTAQATVPHRPSKIYEVNPHAHD